MTVALWVRLDTVANSARLFDLGSNTQTYAFLAARTGLGRPRFAMKLGGMQTEDFVDSDRPLAIGTWTHVAVTAADRLRMYVDGELVGDNPSPVMSPLLLGRTQYNCLGRSQSPTPLARRHARRLPPVRRGARRRGRGRAARGDCCRPRVRVRPGGSTPGHQLRGEGDLLVHVGGVLDLVQQQLGRGPAELHPGLAHGGQRHGGGAGVLDVVVADDREVLGHRDPAGHAPLEQAEGEQVVGAEGAVGRRERGRPASRWAAWRPRPCSVRRCPPGPGGSRRAPRPPAPPGRPRSGCAPGRSSSVRR